MKMIKIITDKEKIRHFKEKSEDINISLFYPKTIVEKEDIIFVDGQLFIKAKLLSKLINEAKKIITVKKHYKYCEKLTKLKMNRVDKIEQGFYRKKKVVNY